MALQTLEGDLIPMRPAKETLTRYAVLLLGAAILSFGSVSYTHLTLPTNSLV